MDAVERFVTLFEGVAKRLAGDARPAPIGQELSMVAQGMLKMAALSALILVGTAPAWAAGPPRLDIKSTCKRAQPLSGAEVSAYQSCINDETQAQKELAKKWSTFKSGPQAVCSRETQLGGAPSYVELLTCLELNQQAQEASRENAKALKIPGARRERKPN